MQNRAPVEWHHNPQFEFAVDPMATFGPEQFEAGTSSARSASIAVHRGRLGIHFDCGGQNLATEENITFVAWQRFEVEFDRLLDVCDGFLQGGAL